MNAIKNNSSNEPDLKSRDFILYNDLYPLIDYEYSNLDNNI